jgi:hypothetical protein
MVRPAIAWPFGSLKGFLNDRSADLPFAAYRRMPSVNALILELQLDERAEGDTRGNLESG